MLNFHENYVRIKKTESNVEKRKKQNKVYYTEIRTIQIVLSTRNIFLSHSHQKKYLLQNPSPRLIRLI